MDRRDQSLADGANELESPVRVRAHVDFEYDVIRRITIVRVAPRPYGLCTYRTSSSFGGKSQFLRRFVMPGWQSKPHCPAENANIGARSTYLVSRIREAFVAWCDVIGREPKDYEEHSSKTEKRDGER